MNSIYPNFVQTKNKKYKINTDYRVALECDRVSRSDISSEERALGIIYLLYGDEGLENSQDWEELLRLALKYLNCGKTVTDNEEQEKPDMDIEQDWEYIRVSFFYDYGVKLGEEDMHWWEFYNLLCGLSDKCILNRVRFIRNFDTNQIKDSNEREKWIKQKEKLALKVQETKTAEEKRLDDLFERQLKGGEIAWTVI